MIIIACLVLGAAFGAFTAQRRGGNRLDKLHYGAIFAILFGIIGMFLTVALEGMI
ncbi:MAG: hypothetical protein ACSHXD_11460 [Marinosulfonomonas sp.]